MQAASSWISLGSRKASSPPRNWSAASARRTTRSSFLVRCEGVMEILLGFWNLVPITLVQGLIYAFVALGVMIPFRIVNIPDITAEGAFPLGGCVAATLLVQGAHPLLATAFAVAAGFCA